MFKIAFQSLVILLTVFGAGRALGLSGVTKSEVHFAMITSMSGAVGATGQKLQAGYEAAFKRFNDRGGIHGRVLKLRIYDDAYNAAQTVLKTSEVIREQSAFAIVGSNGTSTIEAALPMIVKSETLLLFPRTGVESVRLFRSNIFNFRPSFYDEIKTLINFSLLQKRRRIAVLFQTDAFGDALRAASLERINVLSKDRLLGPELVSVAGLNRETTSAKYIESAMARIELGHPDTVVLATSLAASAPFVRLAIERKKPWLFLSVSSTNNLTDKLSGLDANLVVSQVVPNPEDPSGSSDLAIMRDYHADMLRLGASEEIGYTSFEAYINARIIGEALRRSGPDLNQTKFVFSMEDEAFDLGGMTWNWNSGDHNAPSAIYLTKFADGRLSPVAKPNEPSGP